MKAPSYSSLSEPRADLSKRDFELKPQVVDLFAHSALSATRLSSASKESTDCRFDWSCKSNRFASNQISNLARHRLAAQRRSLWVTPLRRTHLDRQ